MVGKYKDIIGKAYSHNRKGLSLVVKALSCYDKQNYELAEACLKEALHTCEEDLDFAVAFFVLGLVYSDSNDFPSALESYNTAIKYNPKHDSAYNNIGLVYRRAGDPEAAIPYFEKALDINGASTFTCLNAAGAYYDLSMPDKAIEYALKALDIEYTSHEAMMFLALAYTKKNDIDKAIEYCNKAILFGYPHPDWLKNMINTMS